LVLCMKVIGDNALSVPPRLMLELIRQESGFEPEAIGHDDEIGLCQIKPDTARFVAAKYGLDLSKGLFDMKTNITAGAYYLHYLYRKYGDGHDWVTPLICYNSGDMWLKIGKPPRKRAVLYAHKIVDRWMSEGEE